MHNNIGTKNNGSTYAMQKKQVIPRSTSVKSARSFKRNSEKALGLSPGHRQAAPTRTYLKWTKSPATSTKAVCALGRYATIRATRPRKR